MPTTIEVNGSPDGGAPAMVLARRLRLLPPHRTAGYKIFADTTLRIGHIGRYTYGWEDAGAAPPRFATFHLQVRKA